MACLSVIASVLFIFISPAAGFQEPAIADTATINTLTGEAYITARRNPGLSIISSHKALRISKQYDYEKGIADASLALGMAYLALYNPDDSAGYYNRKALDIYTRLDDRRGMALAYYGLAYVCSFKGLLGKSEKYSLLSLENFEKAGDERGMLNALSALIYLARQESDFEGAIEMTNRAIETARSVNDTIPLADAINTLGNIYKDMLLFNDAIDSYFEALRLWESKNDSSGMAIAYGSIALMYFYQNDYEQALEFNFKKMPLSERAGDKWELSKTLNNISQVYMAENEYDSALHYLRKGLRLNEEMNYPAGIAGAYHNIASAYTMKGDQDSAYHYISKSIEIAEKINDPELPSCLITLGRIQRRRNNYDKALENTLQAYKIAREQKDQITLAAAAGLLSSVYSETGRKDLAYDYLREYHTLNDSISNNEFLKKVTRLEIQNEYDRKQKAAEFEHRQALLIRENRINQQKMYVKGLIILFILLLVISLFYIRNTRLKAHYERIDLEQRLLRAQMNPHFIFNSLCAIQDLILAGQTGKANTFLVKIARLVRNILENSREEFIALEKEIETLRLYLEVQQLRFESGFTYSFDIDSSIDPENVSVPPMLAQPCLENSIEHGLLPDENAGRIKISYTLQDELLKLEVTDNGTGKEQHKKNARKGMAKKSLSTTLIQERLDFFRKKMKKRNISYEIKNLYENSKPSGTRVIIMMPFKKVFA